MPPKSQNNPTKFIQWFSVEGAVAFLVIFVSLVIAGLSFFDVVQFNSEKLLAANAAILSVLAALIIANSIKLVTQAQALKDLSEQAKRKDLATLVLKQRQQLPNLEEFFQGAKRVLICDAFFSSIHIEQHWLVQLIQSQCDIAIVALDPDNNALLSNMAEFSVLDDIDNLKHLLQGAINNFRLVAQLYTQSGNASEEAAGTLQVGYCSNYLPFTGVLVESRDQNDRVLVELHPFKYDQLKIHRHHFVLDKKNTPELFNTYKESLNSLFNSADKTKFQSQLVQPTPPTP